MALKVIPLKDIINKILIPVSRPEPEYQEPASLRVHPVTDPDPLAPQSQHPGSRRPVSVWSEEPSIVQLQPPDPESLVINSPKHSAPGYGVFYF